VDFLQDWIVHKVLSEAVEKHPDKPFLICNEESVTFKELDEISDVLASGLLEEGFEKGDCIAVMALNQVEWLYTYFAAAKIGVGVVALNVRYRESELVYMLNNAKVKGIVSISEYQGFKITRLLERIQAKVPTVEKFIFIEKGIVGSLSFSELLNRPLDRERLESVKQAVQEDDLVIIIYTSGTTGNPKGTLITNRSILESAKAQVDHLSIREDDRTIGCLPFNHVGGITCTVHCSLISYGSIVLIPEFIPEKILQVIDELKPTVFGGVPTMYIMLLSHNEIKKYNLSSLNICIIGGSNVDPYLCRAIESQLPYAKIINLYGLSESSGACILSRLSDSVAKVQESIGVPIGDFKVKIVDDERKELPTGEVGEMAIKGRCTAKGYLGLEDETNLVFSQDGWLYTGDIAYLDHEGYVVYKGRKKEMYIQGGYNVYPVEVENILMAHPKVALAAGVGVPDAFLGEVGRYYIMPKAGQAITEKEIILYCNQHLADYKVPSQVVFVNQFPQTPAGKIQKTILKQQYLVQEK
jgi:acyl-CoA synthetase (AMP-forming)/AMP-acid ligase II